MSQAELLIEEAPTYPFQFKNHPIRTQLEGGNLWFAARDVCEALTIKWNGRALSAIPDEWQGLRSFLTPSGNQQLRAILEPAVYKLAFRSNKPEADAFTNWIASEVVPSIRKTGRYEITETDAAPGPDAPAASLPLSTTEDRKPLRALVGSWAKLANAPFDACWNQLKAAFQLANIKELPQAWLPDALAWVQEKIDALPAPLSSGDKPPLYRDGAFHLPSPNPRHIPGPREAALMALWKDWGHRARELERQFRELSREVDACRGDLFAHAVSDLGRHTDTCFSTDSLLDGLYASQTVAEDQFKLAMTSLMCQLRLCLNVAVAQNR